MYQLNGSYDQLNLLLIVLTLLSPCSEAISIKSWLIRRRGDTPQRLVHFWTARLICVQTAIMYFGTGIDKITSENWGNGMVLAYNLVGEWGTPAAFWFLSQCKSWAFYDLAALGTILFELYAPIGFFSSRFQKWFFAAGILFHGFIGVMMSVWGFFLLPTTYVLFINPTKVRDWCYRWIGHAIGT